MLPNRCDAKKQDRRNQYHQTVATPKQNRRNKCAETIATLLQDWRNKCGKKKYSNVKKIMFHNKIFSDLRHRNDDNIALRHEDRVTSHRNWSPTCPKIIATNKIAFCVSPRREHKTCARNVTKPLRRQKTRQTQQMLPNSCDAKTKQTQQMCRNSCDAITRLTQQMWPNTWTWKWITEQTREKRCQTHWTWEWTTE